MDFLSTSTAPPTTKVSFVENNFKKNNPLEKRKDDADRVLTRYRDRVPVIVEYQNNYQSEKLFKILDRQKYLVPRELSVAQFMYVIRRRCKVNETKAIFMFFNNTLELPGNLMGPIYDKHHDTEDNFLYAIVGAESTFG